MKKNIYLIGLIVPVLLGMTFLFFNREKNEETKKETHQIKVMVLEKNETTTTIQDENNGIYTISNQTLNGDIGDYFLIEYLGILDDLKKVQDFEVVQLTKLDSIPSEWNEEGLFKNYYSLAFNKLKKLSLDEKIGQLFLARYDASHSLEDLKKYPVGGFVFYEKDFKNKTSASVKEMISKLQENSKIPLLTSVDEEGGKVIRVSSNPNLVREPFKSSQELYALGGFEKIKEDTISKSSILYQLGLNLNLAPVVDVSTNSNDYMYARSFGKSTDETNHYAKTVIEASKGTNVSYTLKHFPGYGNNADTHTTSSTDNRTFESIVKNDLPPFEAGIHAGAEAVLVSHNIVTSIDASQPASLSSSVHNLLRNRLDFTGVIITDDLDMGATSTIPDVALKALLAGNDLIISTNYAQEFNQIKNAVLNQTISEDLVNRVTLRVLAWKYYKGLLSDEK